MKDPADLLVRCHKTKPIANHKAVKDLFAKKEERMCVFNMKDFIKFGAKAFKRIKKENSNYDPSRAFKEGFDLKGKKYFEKTNEPEFLKGESCSGNV